MIAARIEGSFEEAFLFEGTCNGDIFNLWLERQLCPMPGQDHVVVMDNAMFHKGRRTQELIEKTGATLMFLPPYSPDLNPIEHDFAALKKRREYNERLSLDEIIKTYR